MAILDLYVEAFYANKDAWTKVGSTPYIDTQNQPTAYVHTSTKKAECGYFGFTDSEKSSEAITSVYLYMYFKADDKYGVTVFLNDGVDDWELTAFEVQQDWGWLNVDVSSILDTWAKIDVAGIYLKNPSAIYKAVDCAYLKVDYTAGGETFFQSCDGDLSFGGDLSTKPLKRITGFLSFVGDLTLRHLRKHDGSLSFDGDLSTKPLKRLTAALSFLGNLSLKPLKRLTGSLSFLGQLSLKPLKRLEGALSFVGSLTKRQFKSLDGALDFVGTLTTKFLKTKHIEGVLSFLGDLIPKPLKRFTASLSFQGLLTKKVIKSYGGNLSFTGTLGTVFKPASGGTGGANPGKAGGLVNAPIGGAP